MNYYLKKIIFIIIVSVFSINLCACNNEDSEISDSKRLENFLDGFAKEHSYYYNVTSLTKPDSSLYIPLLAIQNGRWDIATPLLEKLVEQNNSDAMYWLASISGGSVLSGYKIASLFERSANLGNPYAALRLNVGAKYCDTYLRGYCDKKWGKIAKNILEAKSKAGNYKAKYHLEILNGTDYKDTLDLALKNANSFYFYPLYKSLRYNRSLSLELRKKAYSLMVSYGFVPVAHLMYLNFGRDLLPAEYYISNLNSLYKTGGVWYSTYNINNDLFDINPRKKYIENIVMSDFILELMKRTKDIQHPNDVVFNYDNLDYYNIKLKNQSLSEITDSDLELIKTKAYDLINDVVPTIYIDEFYYDPNLI